MNVEDSMLYYGMWLELKFHWISVQIKEAVPRPSTQISNIAHMSIELCGKHCSQASARKFDVTSHSLKIILYLRPYSGRAH